MGLDNTVKPRIYYDKDLKGKQDRKTASKREEKPQEKIETEVRSQRIAGQEPEKNKSKKKEQDTKSEESGSSSDSEASSETKEKQQIDWLKGVYNV